MPGLTRPGSILGTRVQRCEDQAFLTRGAIYTDDLVDERLAGAARATFVRSPVAHARIVAVDISAAAAAPGVVAVLTAADLGGLPAHRMLPMYPAPMAQPLLATDVVRFVGEPVAVVLTEDGYAGEDAAELVSVDYDPCRSSSTRRRPPRTACQSGGACQDAPRVGEPFARSTAPRATASKSRPMVGAEGNHADATDLSAGGCPAQALRASSRD